MMEPSDIQALAEAELREAMGEGRIAGVSVDVRSEDNGSEYLDIAIQFASGRGLPSAKEAIVAKRRLRHLLAARGETRFPNVIYLSAADAA